MLFLPKVLGIYKEGEALRENWLGIRNEPGFSVETATAFFDSSELLGKSWKAANGGAKRIVRFWGGKTYHRVRPPKPVLEASESGICLVCAGFL